MMITNMKDYVTLDDDDNDDPDFGFNFEDDMIAQFKQDLSYKSFSHEDQDKRDDGLQKRNIFWLNFVVKMGGPIPDNVYDFDYIDPGIAYFFGASKYDPELGEFKKFLIIDSEIN